MNVAAFLAARGWAVDLEPMSGAGFADIQREPSGSWAREGDLSK